MKQKTLLFASIAVGLLAAILTRSYLATKNVEIARLKAQFVKDHGTLEVVCFKKDVPGGTILTLNEIGHMTVPAKGLRGQAVPAEMYKTVVGRKTLFGHRAEETVFWSDLEGGNPALRTLAGDIKRQMRAVSINASGAAAVSGMVHPADHVDVIGTFSFPGAPDANGRQTTKFVTCTILQNVLVLATGRETAKSIAPTVSGGNYATVTLEVLPREAEMLVFAEQMHGRLSLSLRNPNDTSYERELPAVDFEKIQGEIEELNSKRQAAIR